MPAVRCRAGTPSPSWRRRGVRWGTPAPRLAAGCTEAGGPCRSPCSREPRLGRRAPVPLGAEGLSHRTGAGRELPGHGGCGRARRRAGAQGGGAGEHTHAGERPAPWRRLPEPAPVGRRAPMGRRAPAGPAPRRAGAARSTPGRGAQGTAGAPWGQARRTRAQSCAKLFPGCAGPRWTFSAIVLYYGGLFSPCFPPFPLMAPRAVAGGGPGFPSTADPASIAFPSQNISCSLPRPRGAGVRAALSPSPPGVLPRHSLSPLWGSIPKRSPCSRRENLSLIAWARRRWVDQPGEGGLKPSGILIFLRQHKQWPNFNC